MASALDLALQWRKARAERLAADKVAAALKETEDGLKDQLIERLKKLANKAVSNGDRLIQLVVKDKPTVQKENWPILHKHILKTGQIDLLERRLSVSAVEARWEIGEKVPGVSAIPVETISDTQAKK